MIPDEFVRLAETLAKAARETARRATTDPEVEIKTDGSPVTGTLFNGRPVRCAGPDRLSAVVACISDPDAFDARTTPGMEAVRARTRWNVFDGGCLGYASLARGLVGLCLNGPNLEPFDIAALVPVVEAAGGRITDWRGDALTIESEGEIVATSGPRLHERALEALSGVVQ